MNPARPPEEAQRPQGGTARNERDAAPSEPGLLHVSVAYSPAPRELWEKALRLPDGATVRQALEASGVLEAFAELRPPAELHVGVWGRKAEDSQVLRERDRVELYRPLQVDPKLARRERFRRQGTRAAGLFSQRRPGGKAGY